MPTSISSPAAPPAAVRSLVPSDLARVVAIDAALAGRSRRGFYEKRFAALQHDPGAYVALAAESGERLVAFVFARVLDGEFGGVEPLGALDAIGVDPTVRGEGVATSLLAALEAALRDRGARELRTQVDWSEQELTAFFGAAGFRVAPGVVLERPVADLRAEDAFTRAEIPVRSMTERDLPAIVRLDRKITGRDRTAYYTRTLREALRQSGVRVSHVAEVEGQFAGFLMARVDFGEFGRTEPTAMLDTIGVDPDLVRRGVGNALLDQLVLNLGALRAETVVTEVEWDHFGLLAFLARAGFVRSQRLAFVKRLVAAGRSI